MLSFSSDSQALDHHGLKDLFPCVVCVCVCVRACVCVSGYLQVLSSSKHNLLTMMTKFVEGGSTAWQNDWTNAFSKLGVHRGCANAAELETEAFLAESDNRSMCWIGST